MKKNHKKWKGLNAFIKFDLKMKLTTLFLIAIMFSTYANNSYSQATKINLDLKNTTVAKILDEIEATTQFRFVYNKKFVDLEREVSIKIDKETIEVLLDKLFEDTNTAYKIRDTQIILRNKEISEELVQEEEAILEDPVKIKGTVTDKDGTPLPGATIIEDGTLNGATTDADGNFTLSVAGKSSKIKISFIGFTTQIIEIGGKTEIIIILEESSTSLDEVVVTGYQTISKDRATGSFAIIDKEQIDRQVTTSITDKLEAISPGLLTNVTNEDGGNRVGIILRGISSFRAGSEALIVVDGFPIEGSLESINPNDIESINILQDAAATSIWGVRASNGVVVITTKRGKIGKTSIEFSSFISIGAKPNLNDLQLADSKTFVEVADHFARNGLDIRLANYSSVPGAYNSGMNPVSTAWALTDPDDAASMAAYEAKLNEFKQVDVFPQYSDLLLQNPVNQQYNISFRGGGKTNMYYVSYTHNDNLSAEIGDRFKRDVLNLKNDLFLLNNLKLSVGANISLESGTHNAEGLGVFNGRAANGQYIPRFQLLQDAQGNRIPITLGVTDVTNTNLMNKGYLDWGYNPLDEVENKDVSTSRLNMRLQAGLRWEILPELGLEIKGQYEWQRLTNKDHSSLKTFKARDFVNKFTGVMPNNQLSYNVPLSAVLDQEQTEIKSYYARAAIDYNKKFGSRHEINALTGFELSQTIIEGENKRYLGYSEKNGHYNSNIDWKSLGQGIVSGLLPFPNQKLFNRDQISITERRLISAFANISYTLDSKYTLSASLKADQSNRVGKNERDPNYLWALGGSWNISKEKFMKTANFVNSLKLRASYGVSGNIHENASSLPILTADIHRLTGEELLRLSSFGNSALTFEDTYEFNIGIDFSLFKSKLSGSFEYYNELSKNLLANFTLPATYGFTSVLLNNGEVVNKGITLNLTADIIRKEDFSWTSNFNITYNDSEVLSYELPSSDPVFLIGSLGGINPNSHFLEGERVGTILSYKYAGLDENGYPQVYDSDGEIVPFQGGKVSSREALEVSGTTIAPIYGGFNNTFSYKNFSLNILLSYKMGHIFRKPSMYFSGNTFDRLVLHQDAADRFQAGINEDTDVPVLPNSLGEVINFNNQFYSNSNILVEDASFIRIKQVGLRYELPKSILKKLPFANLILSAQVSNLGMLWTANKYNIDPEAIPFSGSSLGEWTKNPVSIMRPFIKPSPVYTFGFKIQL